MFLDKDTMVCYINMKEVLNHFKFPVLLLIWLGAYQRSGGGSANPVPEEANIAADAVS